MLLIPQTFGPYELDEVLGRGHTGEVYRAWDTRRSRTVALEVLSPELSADPRFRAQFEQVSRAVAAIEEPHVVVVHEVGEVDGRLYRDVQLVDGRALSAVLATEGPLSAVVAVDVVGQVAAALDAAHAAGVVHGSVRASDVLVSGHPDRPECHLTHFGLADRPDGRPADPRADVSALAWLLSELLTGRPRGSDTGGTAPGGGGRHREPPYPTGEDSVPPALEAVVARSTAADPAGRYASAGALAAAARAALRRTSDTVPVQAVSAPASAGVAAGAASGAAGGAAAARTAGVGAAAARQARRRASPPAPRSQRRRELAAVLVAAAVGLTAAGGVVAVRLAADDSDAVASTPVVLEPADDPGDAPFVPAPPGTTGPAGETGDRAPGSAGTPQGGDDPASGSAGTPQDGERPAEESAATTPGGDDTAPGTAGTAPGSGDAGSGDAGSGDAGSGDADSGDADSGDADSGDADSG
ncbi:protein kinase domain-containing protein, partial [Geodermatophilus obscurus]